MKLSVRRILKAVGGELISGRPEEKVEDFSIDSRNIDGREAFMAIKGRRFDGHNFIDEAYQKGVRFFIVSRLKGIKDKTAGSVLIKVADTTSALGQIARLKRQLCKMPLVAVTGSCGKTTTKDMAAKILSTSYKVLKNIGTLNNEFGLPLTLLRLKEDDEVAVLEMGMNHRGEIKMLNGIALADVGVITCVHPVHLKHFKDVSSIARTKWELIETLKGKKTAVLNNDDKNLKPLFRNFKGKKVTFGIKEKSDFMAGDIRLRKNKILFKLNGRYEITLNLVGEFNIYNALAAIAVSRFFKISYDNIKTSLNGFKPSPMRMERMRVGGVEVINDAYNANPESVAQAVKTLCALPKKGRSIMVCCDMLELGAGSKKFHQEIGRLVAASEVDFLITLGRDAKFIYTSALDKGMKKARATHARTKKEAVEILNKIARPKDVVLLKGSRLMKAEEIARCFINCYTP
ncbi:MAG: UDP-N-acetylmuramoyl-tripeptide--D-alanyl-D-alanine ligase [Candidatus Omnitrophica bacterium]|nr:UDP-N-acetylmuramoyl-tripeptide--D-alanyl-D-alanine ligase [Candidatus Omnitrophota bacterium]